LIMCNEPLNPCRGIFLLLLCVSLIDWPCCPNHIYQWWKAIFWIIQDIFFYLSFMLTGNEAQMNGINFNAGFLVSMDVSKDKIPNNGVSYKDLHIDLTRWIRQWSNVGREFHLVTFSSDSLFSDQLFHFVDGKGLANWSYSSGTGIASC
jgi:hypothetical protein